MANKDESKALAKTEGQHPAVPWSGDEHRIRSAAAKEAGLDATSVEADFFTEGFKAGIVMQDPYDGAIVARGRTVLKEKELFRSLRPALQYLGVRKDDYKVKVTGDRFELRVSRVVAEQTNPVLDASKVALMVFFGFATAGLLSYAYVSHALAGVLWGVGLLFGGWQLRRGVVSGRAMLGARIAMALGMLAQEEQLILPPAVEDLDAPA